MDGSQLPGDPHSCTLLDGITLKATEPVVAVQVHALSAGHFSLPEEQFVQPASPGARRIVPSLCFLIQHVSSATGNTTRIVLDLGLRRDVDRYSEPIRRHVATRQPITTDPDVVKSLAAGGLNPDDIDYVIYSHVCLTSQCPNLVLWVRFDSALQGPLGSYRRSPRFSSQHLRCRSRHSGFTFRQGP